ncbi:MAG: outer membrane beta-barrel family protein [Ignavibacteria bacterium]|jgi:outer membrane cobalamin receptor
MKIKITTLVILIILPVFHIKAQQKENGIKNKISGRVLDIVDDSPLQYSNVILFSSSDSLQVRGTATNENGEFTLEKFKPGQYYIKVSFIGYKPKIIDNINITRGQHLSLENIYLERNEFNTEDVVVTDERSPISYEIDKKVINVDQQLTALSGNAVDILENVPSVSVDIEGNVSLRGSSSFQLLIDGKPSILDASDALQQLPASSIKDIEIITNPSAKYDPEGTAGIINIIMKKDEINGLTGILDLNGGLDDKYGGELSLQYIKTGYRLSGSVDYNKRHMDGNRTENSWTIYEGTKSYIDNIGSSNRGRESYGIRGAIDVDLWENGTMRIGARWGDGNSKSASNQNYTEFSDNSTGIYNYISTTNRERSGDRYSINFNFDQTFSSKEHKLSFEAFYNNRNSEEYTLTELMQGSSIISGQKSTEDGPGERFNFKLDYILPLTTSQKFEAGYQSQFNSSEDLTSLLEYDLTKKEYILQDQFSNNPIYDKNIHSLYSLYSGNVSGLGYQLGIRSEYTDRKITVEKSNQSFVIDRWDFFPTVHFSYKLPNNNQAMASYTRRINRPRGWDLEPFDTWMDAFNLRRGSPGLDPEYIDSYELAYQTFVGSVVLSIEGYYRVTDNKIERIRSVYDDNITLHTVKNVGTDYALGTEMMLNFDILPNWNINLLGNLYRYKIESEKNGLPYEAKSNNWSMRFNNSIKFATNTSLQINGHYHGPSVTSQGRYEGNFMLNLAVRQDLFDKILSATLQLRDVLSTRSMEFTTESATYYSYTFMEMETPMIMLNLKYNFNPIKKQNGDRRNSHESDYNGDDFGGGEEF